jgi:hypothetical protein
VTCYAHVTRKATRDWRRSVPQGWPVHKHLELLYRCRTLKMFRLMVAMLEHEYTRSHAQRSKKDMEKLSAFWPYLKREYLSPPWDTWFATACAISGATPNNNPTEAWNKVVKNTSWGLLRASLDATLANLMKRFLVHQGHSYTSRPVCWIATDTTGVPMQLAEEVHAAHALVYPANECINIRTHSVKSACHPRHVFT